MRVPCTLFLNFLNSFRDKPHFAAFLCYNVRMNIGCHVSIAGGIWNAPERAAAFGCGVMQIFTRSPQGGPAPRLTEDTLAKWNAEIKKHNIRNVYIHTPYFINFASANNRIRYGSVSVIRDELERGTLLGARYVMTHLGSAKDIGQDEGVKQTAELLAKSLDGYTGSCKLLIENSAGAGAVIGDNFREIAKIIKRTGSKAIAGICLDTQHSFASGYDWRTTQSFAETIERLNSELGIEKIKMMHANDSKVEFGAHKDRHEHIGDGFIGTDGFRHITRFAEKHGIDMILETEHDKVAEDIAILKKIRQNR